MSEPPGPSGPPEAAAAGSGRPAARRQGREVTTSGEPAEEGDRGLQAERTELAWVRTALACGALTTLTGRLGGGPAPVSYVLGAAVGATGIAAAVLRIGTLRRARVPAGSPPPRLAVALLAASVVAADLMGLVLIAV